VEEGRQAPSSSAAYWVVRSPSMASTNFAAGTPYWAISLARLRWGVPVLAILDVPPLRQRSCDAGPGAWRNGKRCCRPPRWPARSVALALQRSIASLQKAAGSPLSRQDSPAGCGQPHLVQRGMGRRWQLLGGHPRRSGDLRPPGWSLELGCPLRWLQNSPKPLEPGAQPRDSDFPVLAAKIQPPWMCSCPGASAAEPLTLLVGCGSGPFKVVSCAHFRTAQEPRGRVLQNPKQEKEGASQRCLGFKSG